MSGRTRKANRYVKRVMCQAAWAASRTRQTYLAAFYRRMCVRKGTPKAVMALAHHLLLVVFQLLSRNEEYVELGGDYYDQRNKVKVTARLVARLTRLGYYVDLRSAEPGAASAAESERPPDWVEAPLHSTVSNDIPVRRKRGRPCKCAERKIPCKHGTFADLNSLREQPSSPAIFS